MAKKSEKPQPQGAYASKRFKTEVSDLANLIISIEGFDTRFKFVLLEIANAFFYGEGHCKTAAFKYVIEVMARHGEGRKSSSNGPEDELGASNEAEKSLLSIFKRIESGGEKTCGEDDPPVEDA